MQFWQCNLGAKADRYKHLISLHFPEPLRSDLGAIVVSEVTVPVFVTAFVSECESHSETKTG
jgi:hypothetical protein